MLLICFWVPLGEACHEQRMEWYPCLMFTVWEHSLHSYFDWLNLPSYDRMMWHQWAARPDPSHPASRSRIPSDARTQSLQVIRSTPYSGSLCQKWLLFLGAKVVWAKKIRIVAGLEIQITNRLLDWRYLNLWGFYCSWFILADWGMGQNPCNVVKHYETKSPHGPMDHELPCMHPQSGNKKHSKSSLYCWLDR
jgi:hypothetical protein